MRRNHIVKGKLLMLLIAAVIFMMPLQARANLTYTMTAFQSSGPLYASGEITGNLTGDMNIPNLDSLCVDNQALLYQGQPYAATLASIEGNTGLLKSAYLMDKYVPKNSPLTDANMGVALQWAIWMLIGQGVPLTDTSVSNPTLAATYPTVYAQAQKYEQEAFNAGNLTQYAGTYEVLQLQGSQDLLIVPTPIPAAIYLFGSGLMGFFGIRKTIQ